MTSAFANNIENHLGIYKQSSCVNLIQACDNCTSVNITSILNPNGTIDFYNQPMTKNSNVYYYNFCNTSAIGNYIVSGIGYPAGVSTSWNYIFTITRSGDSLISGNMNIFLWLIFIISFIGITLTLLYVIVKLTIWDVTINNLLISWAFFILFILTNYLSQDSINRFIFNFTDSLIYAFGFSNALLPMFAFIASVFYKTLTGKRIH